MSLSPRIIWCAAIALSAAALIPAATSMARASRQSDLQANRLDRLASQARTLEAARSSLPNWTISAPARKGASSTLAQGVSAALIAAGLPASAMSSLSAESGAPAFAGASAGGAAPLVHRRRATLVLGSVTLPQLGSFLQHWRERQPAWIVSQIDVGPEAGAAAAKAATGGDLPLRAVLTLESLSIQPAGGVR